MVKTTINQTIIRPEAALISNGESNRNPEGIMITGEVKERLFQGKYYRVSMTSANGIILTFYLPGGNPPPLINELIKLSLNSQGIVVEPLAEWRK